MAAALQRCGHDVGAALHGLVGNADGVPGWASGRAVTAARAFLDAVLDAGAQVEGGYGHLAAAVAAAADRCEGVERDVSGVLLPSVGPPGTLPP